MIIDTVKYERYGSGDSFWSLTKKAFPIFQEVNPKVTQTRVVNVRI